MDEYEKLLDEAYKKVKKETSNERFEIPQIEGHAEGKKTIINNFFQITSHFRRKPEHLLKFLLKELASQGQIEGDRLILNNVIPKSKINKKVEQYVEEFVICKECKKPDTEIIKDSRIHFLHCLACGAKHPVHEKI